MRNLSRPEHGFTVIELIVVIVIIGIMTAIVVFTPQSFQESADAREQASDTANLMRRLETAYTAQAIGAPSYPSTVELLSDASTRTRTLARIDSEILKAPGSNGSSMVAATTTDVTTPAGAGTPTVIQYIYQPLRADGALCTASPSTSVAANRCIRFFLYYKDAATSTVRQLKSLHQQ